MIRVRPTVAAGGLLWLALCLPALRQVLEHRMAFHMLGQIPLLIFCGFLLAPAIPAAVRRRVRPWDAAGISGLILAASFWMIWMLPVVLDAAVDQPLAALVKFLGLPLLVGIPLRLSWPRAGFLVRALFLVESIATLFRAGWLYRASPDRLCSSYLVGDQQLTGELLLWLGAALLLITLAVLLFGNPLPARAAAAIQGPEQQIRHNDRPQENREQAEHDRPARPACELPFDAVDERYVDQRDDAARDHPKQQPHDDSPTIRETQPAPPPACPRTAAVRPGRWSTHPRIARAEHSGTPSASGSGSRGI